MNKKAWYVGYTYTDYGRAQTTLQLLQSSIRFGLAYDFVEIFVDWRSPLANAYNEYIE